MLVPVFSRRQVQTEREQVVRSKADLGAAHVVECLDHQTGGYKQYDRECDLGHDERIPNPTAPSADAAPRSLFESIVQIDVRAF